MTRSRQYRIPLHPILVTVPLGSWAASLVFDIASKFGDEPGFLARGSYWLIGIGLIGAIVAGLAGVADSLSIPPRSKANRTVMTHFLLVMAAVLLYVSSYVLRSAQPMDRPVPLGFIALGVAGVVIGFGAAVAGGSLAHRYGVRGADEPTRAEGLRQASTPDRNP